MKVHQPISDSNRTPINRQNFVYMKYLYLTLATLVFAACSKPDPSADPTSGDATVSTEVTLTEAQYQAAKVTMGNLSKKSIGASLSVNGMLDVPPQNLITIAAPMGGFVKSTDLLQGMKVKKGQILAVMQHQDYIQLQQDYLESKSKLVYAASEYERQQALAKENVNAQKSLEQSKSQFVTLQASVSGLEAKLAMINVQASSLVDGKIHPTINLYAPISGYITEVNVNIGQYVDATTVMFKLVNIDHLHAELYVYERDISKLSIGQQVHIQLANETKTRLASVYLVGKEIGPDRTVRIHCHLEEEDEQLLPGMYVTATIEIATHEVDALPVSSVISFEGANFVFASLPGKRQFELIEVETGNSADGFIEVHFPPGFDPSRSIVSQGSFELLGVLKNMQEE